MVSHVTAVHLHRFLASGRTRPAVFGCIDSEGKNAGDYVVKLCGAMDTGPRGAASELIVSMLARHFGILRPDPAIVELHPDLVKWLVAQRADVTTVVRNSTGLNFGTKLLTDVATWPPGRALPEAMKIAATHIFAFDALISNDDRRYDNPNVLVRGDEVFIIDHEAAFAFLLVIATGEAPWELQRRSSLDRHVFFYELRKQPLDLGLFTARLAQLGNSELESLMLDIPSEWQHDNLGRISAHLQSVRDHAAEFERQVLERLA